VNPGGGAGWTSYAFTYCPVPAQPPVLLFLLPSLCVAPSVICSMLTRPRSQECPLGAGHCCWDTESTPPPVLSSWGQLEGDLHVLIHEFSNRLCEATLGQACSGCVGCILLSHTMCLREHKCS
jgi:hypothetical protein